MKYDRVGDSGGATENKPSCLVNTPYAPARLHHFHPLSQVSFSNVFASWSSSVTSNSVVILLAAVMGMYFISR